MSFLRPVIIDIEASGFGQGSYPIEIGIIMDDGQSYDFLIHPEPQWTHWDQQAQAVHGIDRSLLLAHGLSIFEVAHALNHLLEGRTAYSDGWGFDSTWLSLLFYEAGQSQTFRMDALTRILSPQQMQLWDRTKASLRVAQGNEHHRALLDARLLQDTFVQTRRLCST